MQIHSFSLFFVVEELSSRPFDRSKPLWEILIIRNFDDREDTTSEVRPHVSVAIIYSSDIEGTNA
jgi:hypothetical protein